MLEMVVVVQLLFLRKKFPSDPVEFCLIKVLDLLRITNI